jgi:hypothetical protein
VLTCGPAPLVASVIDQAQRHTSYACDGLKFDVHKETFAF